jgi:hypothetical protein
MLWILLRHLLPCGILLGAKGQLQQQLQVLCAEYVQDHMPSGSGPHGRCLQRLLPSQRRLQEVRGMHWLPDDLPSRSIRKRTGLAKRLLWHPGVRALHVLHLWDAEPVPLQPVLLPSRDLSNASMASVFLARRLRHSANLLFVH